MSNNLSIVQLLLHASWVVQLVVALLVIGSVTSWTAIFRKAFALKQVVKLNEEFERNFWSGTSLNDLYAAANQNARNGGPMERIYRDQHAAAGHINFSMDAHSTAWGLSTLGGEVVNPTL